jgi:alpha-methylacyl-CoA racemase
MLLAFGIVTALFERETSGRGQVLDVAIVDGVASLLTSLCALEAAGLWSRTRGSNWLDGAAPWYRAYRTADERYVTLGPLEPQFYGIALDRIGLEPREWPQWDRSRWPALHDELKACFATRTAAEWQQLLEGSDACFAVALRIDQAAAHPQLAARGTYIKLGGVLQPAPVPRFSRTAGAVRSPPPENGEHTAQVLAEIRHRPPRD